MQKLLPASLVLALAAPTSALAADTRTQTEIDALRGELTILRGEYEARIQALETRLRALQAPTAATATRTVPPGPATAAQGATVPTPAPATAPMPAPGPNATNPAISLILSGTYTNTSRDPANYAIAGFPHAEGAEIGPGTRGLSLAESELGLSANIDPWLRGVASIGLHPDDSVSVEEAYVETTSLDYGLTLRAGRFLSGVGYLNSQHAHTWDFVDSPLAYQAMFGGQYGDDGIRLSWLAPTDQYLELGLEIGRGRSFPGSDSARNGAGMRALSLHTGGDVGASHSWRAGISVLDVDARDQSLLGTAPDRDPIARRFGGSTRVWIADGVWKWAPNGNGMRTNFKLQGEYLRSLHDGTLGDPSAGDYAAAALHSAQSGWYLQGVYQFMPRWRLGLRTERLSPGDPGSAVFGTTGLRPSRQSAMLDFSPSEFSRLRLQLVDERARPGARDKQILLQYLMSLGAHGAHPF